jgi:hypothetical protein
MISKVFIDKDIDRVLNNILRSSSVFSESSCVR